MRQVVENHFSHSKGESSHNHLKPTIDEASVLRLGTVQSPNIAIMDNQFEPEHAHNLSQKLEIRNSKDFSTQITMPPVSASNQ